MNEMAKLIVRNAARGIAVALAAGLAGCGGFNGIEDAQYDANYTHPISVETDVATLNVGVVAGQPGLAPSERSAIEAFAAAYRQRGHGPLTIWTPSGSPNAGAAAVALSDVRDILAENGVTSVAYTTYRAVVADPAGLAGPRTMTPADAGRRDTVLEKYRAGQPTATQRTEQDSGAVS